MTGRARAARVWQVSLVVVGVALFASMVHSIGPERLLNDLRGFGLAIIGVIALELGIDAGNTMAWRKTLPPNAPIGFGLLFWVRQAGVALNQVTPTATVGGEVAKAVLLRSRLPMATTAASLVAARMSYALAQAIVVLAGLASVFANLHTPPGLGLAMVGGFLLISSGVLTFLWLQRRGIFVTLVAVARRFGFTGRLSERLHAGGAALDAQLVELYRDRPAAFAESVGWHVGGQAIGVLQLFYILAALDVPTPLTTCLALEAFAIVLDSAAFLVPARIGVQEASRVLAFTALGLSAATGLATAVIVRVNQLAVAGIGLAAFGWLTFSAPSPVAPSSKI